MKKKNIGYGLPLTGLLFLLQLTTTAQADLQKKLADARKAIAESNEIYFQAFVKADSSIFIDRYAEDCWIMAPDAQIFCGPDAPLEFFKLAYGSFGLRNGKFITADVYGITEDIVAEVGFWQSFDANNVLFDDGKFLVLWKRTSKGWKMFRDSFSSNRDKK